MSIVNTIKIETLKPEHSKPLAELQQVCLPTLGADDLLREEHFLSHCKLFPEGNFVAKLGDKIVGLGSGLLVDFDFDHPHHRYMDMISDGYYTNHDPRGAWYYGSDISVHPHYRRRGIGKKLYEARKGVIKRLNRKGLVAGGLLPGYARHKKKMTPHQYVEKVVAGKIHDTTLSFQLKQGFKVLGLIEDYLEDDASDNWATLIVWYNPDYQP